MKYLDYLRKEELTNAIIEWNKFLNEQNQQIQGFGQNRSHKNYYKIEKKQSTNRNKQLVDYYFVEYVLFEKILLERKNNLIADKYKEQLRLLKDLVIKYAQYQIAIQNEESKSDNENDEIQEDDSISNTALAIPQRQQSIISDISYIQNPKEKMHELISRNYVYDKIELSGQIQVIKSIQSIQKGNKTIQKQITTITGSIPQNVIDAIKKEQHQYKDMIQKCNKNCRLLMADDKRKGTIQYILAKVEKQNDIDILLIKNGRGQNFIRLDSQDEFTPIYYTYGDDKTEKQIKNFMEQQKLGMRYKNKSSLETYISSLSCVFDLIKFMVQMNTQLAIVNKTCDSVVLVEQQKTEQKKQDVLIEQQKTEQDKTKFKIKLLEMLDAGKITFEQLEKLSI